MSTQAFRLGVDVWFDAVLLCVAMLAIGLVLSGLWARGLQPTLSAIGRLLHVADDLLVRRVSWAFGTRWVTGRYATARRWSHMVVAFLALAFVGAVAPLAPALMALLTGYLGALAIIRQWSWDERDRAEDTPEDFRRVPGGEDLVNEAAFAGACLFLLTPIFFFRLDATFGLLSRPPALGHVAYVAYTFGEFLKAVPLFDYSEVYGTQNISGVTPQSLAARHMTFAFRVTLDLVLIGGLLQLVAVMQRVTAGRDIRKLQLALSSTDSGVVATTIARLRQLGMRRQANAQRALVYVLSTRDSQLDPQFSMRVRLLAAHALDAIANRLTDTPLFLTVIDAYRALLREQPSGSQQWADVQNALGDALRNFGARLGGTEGDVRLREAIAAYREALSVRTQKARPTEWAATQNSLGLALRTLGRWSGGEQGASLLEQAIEAYEAALTVRTRAQMEAEWAATRNNLGLAFRTLGRWRSGLDGTQTLRQAVAAYRDALTVRTFSDRPVQRAATLNHLGSALGAIAERITGEEGANSLVEAVDIYREALSIYTRQNHAPQWASTTNNLAFVLRSWGERTSGPRGMALIRDALSLHNAALSEYTRQSFPNQWALGQNNIGLVLRALARRASGPEWRARCVEAIGAYQNALTVRTRLIMSADWATTNNNLGAAHLLLGQRLAGSEGVNHLQASVAASEAALEVRSREQMPAEWAVANNSLAAALIALAARLEDAPAIKTLERAIDACNNALSVRTPTDNPMQWASTKKNIGNALSSLADRIKDGACHERALVFHQEGVGALSETHTAVQWASAQNALGAALCAAAAHYAPSQRQEPLNRAVEALGAALTVRTQADMMPQWAISQFNLGRTLTMTHGAEADAGKKHLDYAIGAFAELRMTEHLQTARHLLESMGHGSEIN